MLFEALTGEAFDGVNCQHRGAFDLFFFVIVKCPGVFPEGEWDGRSWN